jgi:prevent-host-death family protein
MDTIAHRELRNNSSAVLARVAAGESIAVTNHGEVAAVLVPPAASVLERVLEARAARLPRTDRTPFSAIDRAAGPATTAILEDLRGDR